MSITVSLTEEPSWLINARDREVHISSGADCILCGLKNLLLDYNYDSRIGTVAFFSTPKLSLLLCRKATIY